MEGIDNKYLIRPGTDLNSALITDMAVSRFLTKEYDIKSHCVYFNPLFKNSAFIRPPFN